MHDILAELTNTISNQNVDQWWYFGLWGLLGSFIVDGLNLARNLDNPKKKFDRRNINLEFFVGTILRLLIGAILAICFGLSGQITGEVGALVVGITAPAIVDRILKSGDTNINV